MNTRQLLAIEYLNQFGEDIIFKNSYEFYIKGKRGEYIFQNMEIVMITELYDI